MKIVVLDGYALNPGDLSWESLEALGDVTIYERTEPDQLIEHAHEADVLLVNKIKFRKTHFEALPNLKYIGVLATGYNVIDLEAADAHGVVVTNIPTYGTEAVAQFVFAHLLEICHHIPLHSKSVKAGKWSTHADFCYWEKPLIELYGKTMGIIGGGRIGMKTAEIALAFGMTVKLYTRTPDSSKQTDRLSFCSLDDLLYDADVISLHLPLTQTTRGIIDAEAFKKMKDGVILINTARGPLIDETALVQALRSGKVYAAGLDVLSKEPPKPDTDLFQFETVNITPHIAWAPKETRARLLNLAVENVRHFILGTPINQVNGGVSW